MSATFRYISSTSCLHEQGKKPKTELSQLDANAHPGFVEELSYEWAKFIALRSIFTNFKDWPERDLIEGRDFIVENSKAIFIDWEMEENFTSQSKEESEEGKNYRDLYYTIYGAISAGENMEQTIENIKSTYKISKRI